MALTDARFALAGMHHVSALTRSAQQNLAFYTRVMGLRLVKRTVNQDDPGMYHLFYGDGAATPGSELTFFEFPMAAREHRGTNSITLTTYRVRAGGALAFWQERLDAHGVRHEGIVTRDGRRALHFEDPDGTLLALVEDDAAGDAHPWPRSPVPEAMQLLGLGYNVVSVASLEPTARFLTEGLGFRHARTYDAPTGVAYTVEVFELGGGGLHAELHVTERPTLPRAKPGAGSVHHLALMIPETGGAPAWAEHLQALGYPNSGVVDRHYFRSVYIRDPNGIVVELATREPGLDVDEPLETIGERLALPPFLEPRRAEIERTLRPLEEHEGPAGPEA